MTALRCNDTYTSAGRFTEWWEWADGSTLCIDRDDLAGWTVTYQSRAGGAFAGSRSWVDLDELIRWWTPARRAVAPCTVVERLEAELPALAGVTR